MSDGAGGSGIGTVEVDSKNVDLALSKHNKPAAIKEVCALLSNDAQTAIGNLPTPDQQLTDDLNTAYEDATAAGDDCFNGAGGNEAAAGPVGRPSGPSWSRCWPSADRAGPGDHRPDPDHRHHRATVRRRRSLRRRPVSGAADGRGGRSIRPPASAGAVGHAHRTVRGREPGGRRPQPDDVQLGHAGGHVAEAGGRGRRVRLGHPSAHRTGRVVQRQPARPVRPGPGPPLRQAGPGRRARRPTGVATSLQGEPVVEVAGGLPGLAASVAWLACSVRSVTEWDDLVPGGRSRRRPATSWWWARWSTRGVGPPGRPPVTTTPSCRWPTPA